MKKIVVLMLILFFIQTVSCKREDFDLYPIDKLSPSSFWKTENDANAALAGCYNALKDVIAYVYIYLEVLTPNAYNEYPWEGWKDINKGTHTPLSPHGPALLWRASYLGIGRVNLFLANVDKVQMDDNNKAIMKGEALFLRAYFYSNLVNYFGGVPLILEPPSLEQAKTPRNTQEQVMTQVYKDLEGATAVLPENRPDQENGHATKGAALALKTRLLLYEKKYSETVTAAKGVIDLNQYLLFPSYRGLFLPENENNNEVIFDIQFKAPEYGSAWDTYLGIYDGNIITGAIGWSSIEPTTDFVGEYELIDGTVWSPENPVADPADKYNNRDPRLDQTKNITANLILSMIKDMQAFIQDLILRNIRYMILPGELLILIILNQK